MNWKLSGLILLILPVFANAIDHNNVDAGRPLRFEDASTIAFGERVFEFGASSSLFRRSRPSYGLVAEFKYGLALDQEIGIGVENEFMNGLSDNSGHVELRYLRQLRRDMENAPALALGFNVAAPYGDASGDPEFGVRAVASHQVGQFDWLHLNADVIMGDHAPEYGLLLGFSRPLGYPREFSQTFVAEVGLHRGQDRRWGLSGGIGVRRQLSPRAVIDYGVIVQGLGNGQDQGVKLNVGYSISF